jgi:hypothetical protein
MYKYFLTYVSLLCVNGVKYVVCCALVSDETSRARRLEAHSQVNLVCDSDKVAILSNIFF